KLDEALQYAEIAERHALPDDLQTLIPARRAKAGALALRGQHEHAETLAHEALELAMRTDWTTLTADTHLALARIHRLAGGHPLASAAAEQALALYQRKGNLASANTSRAFLANAVTVA